MVTSSLPARLNHNRYIIYRMLGKKVSFISPGKGVRKVTGLAEGVSRDIFDNVVEVTVKGKVFRFKEPDIIAWTSGKEAILFVYGNPKDEPDLSDKALFRDIRASHYKGETMNDVIARTTPGKVRVTRFRFIPAKSRH